jgi:hypothetical protein
LETHKEAQRLIGDLTVKMKDMYKAEHEELDKIQLRLDAIMKMLQ